MLVTVSVEFPLLVMVRMAVAVRPVATFPNARLPDTPIIRWVGPPACTTAQVRAWSMARVGRSENGNCA